MHLAIRVQPVSINTTINATVTFTCEGVGNVITVEVNGEMATNTDVMDREFFVETSSDNGTISAKLRATAYEDNNNTNISCIIETDNASLCSDVAILMIQG